MEYLVTLCDCVNYELLWVLTKLNTLEFEVYRCLNHTLNPQIQIKAL